MAGRLRRIVRRFFSDRRGSLTQDALWTAAGIAAVGATVPAVVGAADAAGKTFGEQVRVLKDGSSPSGGAGGVGGAMGGSWDIAFDQNGVRVGNGSVNIAAGRGGVSGSVRNLGGGGTVVGANGAPIQGQSAPISGQSGPTQGQSGPTQGQSAPAAGRGQPAPGHGGAVHASKELSKVFM